MRLGIAMPFRQPDGGAPTIADVTRRAQKIEQAGFDGIWIGDAVSRGVTPKPDPLMWLAVAAAATHNIELGMAVIQVPLRHTVELAQRLLTLHALTGGRFTAGLGAGSSAADYEALGLDFSERFSLLSTAVPMIRALCRGEQVGAANLHPWPNATGGPPILIGSWASDIWLRRAAHDYDGWMASGRTPFNDIREGIKRFRGEGGKRAVLATVNVNLSAPDKSLPDDERFQLFCGPELAAERLQRIADLGYDDVLITRLDHTEADITDDDLLAIRALVPKAS